MESNESGGMSSVCVLDSPGNGIPQIRKTSLEQVIETPAEGKHGDTDPLSPEVQYSRSSRSGRGTKHALLQHRLSLSADIFRTHEKVEEWLGGLVKTEKEIPSSSPRLRRDFNRLYGFMNLKKSASTPVLTDPQMFRSSVSRTVSPPGTSKYQGGADEANSVTSEAQHNRSNFQMGCAALSPADEIHIRAMVQEHRLMLLPLYQSSIHGFDPLVFHKLCDDHGPSVTLITLKSGVMVGCYTSVGWYSRGKSVPDRKAVLFRVKPQYPHIKLTAEQGEGACHIYDDPDLGPFFGSADRPALRMFCNVYQEQCAQIYEGGPFENGNLLELFGINEYGPIEIEDIEVYDASTRYPLLLERPWRDVAFNDLQTFIDLIDFFVAYKPDFCSIDYVNILLIGPQGTGKSSLFNTFESTFKGHITSRARPGNGTTATSNQFRRYSILPSMRREPLRVKICDTPGLTDSNFSVNDLVYILDGHIPDRFQFPANGSFITNRSLGFVSDSTIKDEMHCIALVLDATDIPKVGSAMYNHIMELSDQVNARDVAIRIVLTKIDLACRYVHANLANVYRSCVITDIVDRVARTFQTPRNYIYPVKCYEHEINQIQNIGVTVLSAFQNLLYAAESFLEDRDLQLLNERKLRSASNVSGGSGSHPSLTLPSRYRSSSDLVYVPKERTSETVTSTSSSVSRPLVARTTSLNIQ